MTKLWSAKILGILLMITAILMALVHYTVTNLSTMTTYWGWSDAMLAWVSVMGGTVNSLVTMSSFITGLTPQTQWLIAWLVILGFFLTGLGMLWKPKFFAAIAIFLLGLELFLQIHAYNSTILSLSAYTGTSIWSVMTMAYVADLNLILLVLLAATTALLCGSIYLFYKSRKLDWW